MPRFGSVVTAMVTPFGDDGRVDHQVAAELARHLVTTGTDGLVVVGSTGEGPVLSDAERVELFRTVIGAVDVPVIASTGTNDTAHSVMLTEEAATCGADGVLVVTPYYNRPSRAGSPRTSEPSPPQRPASRALRHPGAIGPSDRCRADRRARPRRSHHRGGEGRDR